MLTIRTLDPADALALLGDHPSRTMTPDQWAEFRRWRGLVAFSADRDGAMAGFALAESHPKIVHVLNLEGDARSCRLLLRRLVKLAGERDMSGWFPVVRTDVRRMLRLLGFVRRVRDLFQGRPSYLYCWRRRENRGTGRPRADSPDGTA